MVPGSPVTRRLALGAVFLAGVAVPAAHAGAAPISCAIREVDGLGAGQVPDPTIVLAGGGRGGVVWTPSSEGTGVLAGMRLRGAAPSGAATHLDGPGRVRGVRVVEPPGGGSLVVFQRDSATGPPTVMAAVLGRAGFSEPATLSRGHASRPDISMAPDGEARAVWIEVVGSEGFRVVTARYRSGPGWSAPTTIATSPVGTQISDVRVLAGSTGRAVIAWRTHPGARDGFGVEVLRLGPGGAPSAPPLAVREGAGLVADLALGGSPEDAFLAWRDAQPGETSQAVSGAHVPADGPPGPVQRLSAEGSTGLAPLVSSSRHHLGLVGWTEQVGGRQTMRVSRLDTLTGELTPWTASVIARDSRIALAVASDGRGAVAWRAPGDDGRRVMIASGPLNRARPSDSGTVPTPQAVRGIDRDRSVAPALGLARAGRLAVAVTAPTESFRTTLAVATCAPPGAGVSLTAAQLRINQRISQAAIRRLNVLTGRVDGLPAPAPEGGTDQAGDVHAQREAVCGSTSGSPRPPSGGPTLWRCVFGESSHRLMSRACVRAGSRSASANS